MTNPSYHVSPSIELGKYLITLRAFGSQAVTSILCLIAMFVASNAFAEGSRSSYERALSLSDRYRDKVFRDHVKAQWTDDHHFTYRVQVAPKQFETIEVDVASHSKCSAKIQSSGDPPLMDAKTKLSDSDSRRESKSPDRRFEVIQEIIPGDRRELTLIESSPKDQLQPKVTTRRYDKPGDAIDRTKLHLKNLETNEKHPIDDASFPNPFSISEIRWLADSSGFTFLYNERGHQKLQLIYVDAATRQTKIIVDEQSETFVNYSSKSFHEYIDESGELIWASERDGWCHLYLYDLRTGMIKNQITKGDWVVRGIESIDRDSRRILLVASGLNSEQDPYYRHLCSVDFDGGNFRQLTSGNGDHQWKFSPNGAYFIDTYSRIDMPPVTELRSTRTGEMLLELERADDRELRAAGWQVPQPFVAKGRDGKTDIYGMIIRPSHFQPGQKYPVIEAIYAGPHSSFTPKKFGLHNEYCQLAELGFIVVKLDGMGTSNRSKAFHDVCWKNIADAGFPDRRLWIEAVAKAHPEIDATRVGIYGGSAGGQSAMGALLFHGDFYDCAVADCGCHDNRMDKIWWNEQWMGWPIGPHYEEQSNVTNAHRLKGNLMLIVGELDSNVDPASTLQVVNALIKADKDFEMLYVPGGKHGVGSQPYGRRRTWDFFVRHLLKDGSR